MKRHYLAHDKGESAKGAGGNVNLLATYDTRQMCNQFPDGRAVAMTTDGAKSGDASDDGAEKIATSLF